MTMLFSNLFHNKVYYIGIALYSVYQLELLEV